MKRGGFRRREFLKLCAAGTAGFGLGNWLGCRSRGGAGTGAGKKGLGPVGMQSYSLRKFDVIEAIRKTQELGLNHIEIFPGHFPPESDESRVDQVRAALKESGVALSAYGVVRLGPDEAANRRYFQFARKLGIPSLSADPDPTDETMALVEKLAAEHGIKIAIHNHGPGSRYSTVEDVLKVAEGRNEYIGACVDTGHFLRSGVDPVEAIRRLGKRVHGVHLKDWAGVEGEWPVFGEGKLDMVAVFRSLKEIGFTGFISIEYEAHPDEPMDYLRRCVAAIQEALAKAG